VKDFVSEELLGGGGIDVGDGDPIASVIPNSSRSETMDVWMLLNEAPKCLGHSDDTGTGLRVSDGFDHQLFDGLIGEPGQISQKLSSVHEVGA
jgi:hypothetical protein